MARVAIVGGGPAGSTAALTLLKLGHQPIVFERETFPRYRIGESLLPGTLSILSRLGVVDQVEAAGFTSKPAATFLWGEGKPPWSFTFATPKTAPWTFDHSFQVNRDEYDQILLDEAARRGADVRFEHEVTGIDLGEGGAPSRLGIRSEAGTDELEADFVIDASGSTGVIAKKLGLRRFDAYFKNMAIWSYWKGGKRYGGDLAGNILSISWKEGWIWMIPLKDDVYSVGVVVDIGASKRIKEIGAKPFYLECIGRCAQAAEVLEGAEQVDDMHVVRDWAYDATKLSLGGRAFLSGDSGCFIDPLFSQGVHLATYTATLCAAGIDHVSRKPEAADAVATWYDTSYREAYNRYHRFLAGFYATIDEPESEFWSARKIEGADTRFANTDWFTALSGQKLEADADGAAEVERDAAHLASLWEHSQTGLSEEFSTEEIVNRRIRFANELLGAQKKLREVRWASDVVKLVPHFRVDPESFRIEAVELLGDGEGRILHGHPVGEEHRKLFTRLAVEPMTSRELAKALKAIGMTGAVDAFILHLFEAKMLVGRDKHGEIVRIHSGLRFGGVGAGDDLS
jgi:flavin-dependent dehydrogenase